MVLTLEALYQLEQLFSRSGIFWNFMAPTKINKQIEAQKLLREGLRYEYEQMSLQYKIRLFWQISVSKMPWQVFTKHRFS
jgi:hypothetical protein